MTRLPDNADSRGTPSRGEADHRSAAPIVPAPGPSTKDSAGAWLDLVASMLGPPEPQRAEIRAELESHLRDRIGDLMLGGLDAEDATTRAIAELGDAAELAARFRQVHHDTRRRRLMNLGLSMTGMGLAAGAAVVSIAALLRPAWQPAGPPATPHASPAQPAAAAPAETTPPAGLAAEHMQELARLRAENAQLRERALAHTPREFTEPYPQRPAALDTLDAMRLRYEEISNRPLLDVFEMVAQRAGLKLSLVSDLPPDVRVPELAVPGRDDSAMPASGLDTTFSGLLSSNVVLPPRYGYRVVGDVLEIGTRQDINARERSVRAYDIDFFLSYGDNSAEQLLNAMKSLANPAMTPGGVLDDFVIVGPTLFATGDELTHRRVEWVLRQALPVPAAPSRAVPAAPSAQPQSDDAAPAHQP